MQRLAQALGIETAPANMTVDEVAAKAAAEASLYEFGKQAWPLIEPTTEFREGWHIQGIALHLEALVAGTIPHLIVNQPPGTMKSTLASVFLHPWAWIHQPSLRFLYGSYDGQLTTRDALRSRQIILSPWYQRNWGDRVVLAGDQNQKTRYDNTAGGWRISTSVGGRGTGEHPDCVICDDPHSAKKAESATERQQALRWWDGTIASRGVIRKVRTAVVMQRLAPGDLTGHILDKAPDGLEHICLPMRYEPDRMQRTSLGWQDPRRKPGELLWDAYDERQVQQMELKMGTLRANGQLQQRPVPLEGVLFDDNWFEIVDSVA